MNDFCKFSIIILAAMLTAALTSVLKRWMAGYLPWAAESGLLLGIQIGIIVVVSMLLANIFFSKR